MTLIKIMITLIFCLLIKTSISECQAYRDPLVYLNTPISIVSTFDNCHRCLEHIPSTNNFAFKNCDKNNSNQSFLMDSNFLKFVLVSTHAKDHYLNKNKTFDISNTIMINAVSSDEDVAFYYAYEKKCLKYIKNLTSTIESFKETCFMPNTNPLYVLWSI